MESHDDPGSADATDAPTATTQTQPPTEVPIEKGRSARDQNLATARMDEDVEEGPLAHDMGAQHGGAGDHGDQEKETGDEGDEDEGDDGEEEENDNEEDEGEGEGEGEDQQDLDEAIDEADAIAMLALGRHAAMTSAHHAPAAAAAAATTSSGSGKKGEKAGSSSSRSKAKSRNDTPNLVDAGGVDADTHMVPSRDDGVC